MPMNPRALKPAVRGRLVLVYACSVAVLLMPSSLVGQDQVSGTVVDAAGRPVAAARVADFWTSAGDDQNAQGSMHPFNMTETDAEGRFTITLQFYGRPSALLAIDAAQQHGGIAVIDPQRLDTPVSIRLVPLIEVRGRFSCDELARPPSWTNVYVEHKPSGKRLLQCDSKNATFAFKLPPGEYGFNGYGSDVHGVDRPLTLTAEKPVLDMGTIDLRATGIAKHKGKEPPPWNVTDARGVPKTVRYADFKGKWVLMEFWGFW